MPRPKPFLQISVERLLDDKWAELVSDLEQRPGFRKTKNRARGVEGGVLEVAREDLPWLLAFYKKWGWLELGRLTVVYQGRPTPLLRIMQLCFKDVFPAGGIALSVDADAVRDVLAIEDAVGPRDLLDRLDSGRLGAATKKETPKHEAP